VSLEITGLWDEIIHRLDLRGHRVKVTVLDDMKTSVVSHGAWLNGLKRMMAGGIRTGQDVDTDREDIYSGTVDDSR